MYMDDCKAISGLVWVEKIFSFFSLGLIHVLEDDRWIGAKEVVAKGAFIFILFLF